MCDLSLSLRVVFALAKGTPIVSSDWVAECSSKQASRVGPVCHYCAIQSLSLTKHLPIRTHVSLGLEGRFSLSERDCEEEEGNKEDIPGTHLLPWSISPSNP